MKTVRETPKTKQFELVNEEGKVLQKVCRTCQLVQLIENFPINYRHYYKADCKSCQAKRLKVYKEANPLKRKVYKQNQRAKEVNVPQGFTEEDLRELKELAQGRCMLSGKVSEVLEIEHVQALSKEWLGSTKGNIILVAPEVNSAKRTKKLFDFMKSHPEMIDKKQLRMTLEYLAEANNLDLQAYLQFLNNCEELAQKNKEFWR